MRKIVSVGLIFVMTLAAASSTLVAQSGGTMTGVARGNHLQSLASVNVQLRNFNTGIVVGTTTTTEAGSFTFGALPAGKYIAEVVDAAGKVLGVGAPVSLPAGGTATTSVIALAFGATTAASTASGFSFLGMGPVTTMTILGAAAAASVTAVVATRPNASPSR
jgi:hypothetical protein